MTHRRTQRTQRPQRLTVTVTDSHAALPCRTVALSVTEWLSRAVKLGNLKQNQAGAITSGADKTWIWVEFPLLPHSISSVDRRPFPNK